MEGRREGQRFFDQLRRIYSLTGPPEFQYTTPLLDAWTGLAYDSDSQLTWEIKPSTFLQFHASKFYRRLFLSFQPV